MDVLLGRGGTDSHGNKGEYGSTDTPCSIVIEVEETNCQAAQDNRELQPRQERPLVGEEDCVW